MSLKAIKDKILIRIDENTAISTGGIILAEEYTANRGVITAIGKDVKDVKEGDYVQVNPYKGQIVEKGGIKYLVNVKEEDVEFVIEDKHAIIKEQREC